MGVAFGGMALALALAGCATENANRSAEAQPAERGGTCLTGSYLKQDARRNGRISDGVDNVRIYDSQDIRRSGQSTPRDFLIRQGAVP